MNEQEEALKKAQERNVLLEHLLYDLANEACHIRDRLQIIVDGEIERERYTPGHSLSCLNNGKRKVTLKDAKSICEIAIGRINKAVNTAHDTAHPSPFPKS